MTQDLFLGFDLSTQQLKIIVTDGNLKHYKTYRVDFDAELSKYDIRNGVRSNPDTGEIYSPVEMWIESLDLVLGKMQQDAFPFDQVKGMSGSCQQHGSIYWSELAPEVLANLDASRDLKSQFGLDSFATNHSPNWQDHSTGDELQIFENSVGGESKLSEITGSRAHYRFTGPQIRKISKKIPHVYAKTHRISLVSSFLSSLLCGFITNIEESDACGMNLYDVEKAQWDDNLLAVAASVHPDIDGSSPADTAKGVQDLKAKIGQVDKVGFKSISGIAPYYVKKYGFTKDCKVFPFTGDNLATILALPLGNNDILISLGTSTTVLLVTDKYVTSPNYHLFKHPTIDKSYMGMICYCNGSLPRVSINKKLNSSYGVADSSSWDKFGDILTHSKPLNGENKLGVYFDKGEIVPNCLPQTRRFQFDTDAHDLKELQSWPIEQDVSSIVESQALSCRLRAGPLLASVAAQSDDFSEAELATLSKLAKFGAIESDGVLQSEKALVSHPNRIFYVGGASKNQQIIQKFASILGPLKGNYKVELNDACALGGCYKSIWSYKSEEESLTLSYNEWLHKNFRYEDNVEEFQAQDEWEEYVDGIGILSLIEKQLLK